MSLIRYTPFADFASFPAGLGIFQDSVNKLLSEPNGRPWVPPVDIQETENELIFKADVPDVDMKDVDVRMENGALTLRGERKFEAKKEDGAWHRVERSYGTFERVFTLPDTVEPEQSEGRLQERHADHRAAEEGSREAAANQGRDQQEQVTQALVCLYRGRAECPSPFFVCAKM